MLTSKYTQSFDSILTIQKRVVNSALLFVLSFFTFTASSANAPLGLTAHTSLPDGILLGDIYGLDPALSPGENFDLLDWNLSLPIDHNKDGTAETIPEKALNEGFQVKPLFFTGETGAMVFVAPNYGAKTSKNTKYTRTELREMLRRGNTRIKARGISKNNWIFSSAHHKNRKKSGGVDGSLEGTLSVNRVSTTGDIKKVGRVIIGQIHATDDEPIRLYYRKLPNNEKGSVYFAHEIRDGEDQWVNLVGSRSETIANPEEGIMLNEIFSYKITVVEHQLIVTLIRQGKKNITQTYDMTKSGYDSSSQWMYFKAGVYNQNNSGDKNDFVQASFYHLNNAHNDYSY